MHEQNKKFNKEKETIKKTKNKTNKKNQTEILELKRTMTELKNPIESSKDSTMQKKE